MKFGNREIGKDNPVFLVSEISCSHEGSLDNAIYLIDQAATQGADGVKFQLYTPDDLTLNSAAPRFVIQDGPWAGYKLWDLYDKAKTPRAWFPRLFEHARSRGLVSFSSVFSEEGIAYLETLDCPAYKIASPEITHVELIRCAAETGKPVILSTGMAELSDIAFARLTCVLENNFNSIWLHCISAYPTPLEDMNLRTLQHFAQRTFYYGLSDHSTGIIAPMVATALGACMIEKHLMSDLPNNSLDKGHSLTPEQFGQMVRAVREVEDSLGTVRQGPLPVEESSHIFKRRDVGGKMLRCAALPTKVN